MARSDPNTVFNWYLELGGGKVGFLECAGLKTQTEVVEYAEGGENAFSHKFPGPAKQTNILLKHGYGKWSKELRAWRDAVIYYRHPFFLDGALVLIDDLGKETMRFTFSNAYPVRWEGGTLKHDQGAGLLVETLEVAVEFLDPRFPGDKPPGGGGDDPNVGGESIQADFVPKQSSISPGEQVEFKDRSWCNTSIVSWLWQCPQNNNWTSASKDATIPFDKPGAYSVKLTVTGAKGKQSSTTGTVNVKTSDVIKAEFEFNNAIIRDNKFPDFEKIPFDYDSHALRPDALGILAKAVDVFKKNPGLKADLEGWASVEGGADYNKKLSQRRVNSVKDYMTSKVGANRITSAVGMGETDKFDKNNLAPNRRVEWHVKAGTGKLRIWKGDKVQFTDKSQCSSKIVKWEWSCDAVGWKSTEQNPVYQFNQAGTFDVTLKVTSQNDTVSQVTHPVLVEDPDGGGTPPKEKTPDQVKAEFEFNNAMVRDNTLPDLERIPFEPDSPALRPDAITLLAKAADIFRKNPGLKAALEGYAAKAPSAVGHMWLSQARANAVKDYMTAKVGPNRIVSAVGKGETDKFDKENWAPNRRVMWILKPGSSKLRIWKGDKVQFTDKSQSSTSIKSWEWTCDAIGWQSSDRNPQQAFNDAGTFKVNLKVTSEDGTVAEKSHDVTVEDPDKA